MTITATVPQPDVQQKKPQPEWGVTFPDAEQVGLYRRDSLVATCYGYERIASVLNYLLYQASWERTNQKLPKECKVVTFIRTHKDILKALTFKLSRKSLIGYLDKLAEWKYVDSQKFQRSFTVHFDIVQKNIDTPPARQARPVRAQKGCKVVKVQPSEREQELAKKVEELQQNVELLQRKVEELQPLVCNVTTLQRDFTALLALLQGQFSDDSILLSISSLSSIDKEDTSAIAPPARASSLSQQIDGWIDTAHRMQAVKPEQSRAEDGWKASPASHEDEIDPEATVKVPAVRIGGTNGYTNNTAVNHSNGSSHQHVSTDKDSGHSGQSDAVSQRATEPQGVAPAQTVRGVSEPTGTLSHGGAAALSPSAGTLPPRASTQSGPRAPGSKGKNGAVTQVAPPIPDAALAILDDWDSLFKAPVARTEKHVEAAVKLIRCKPTKADLKKCKAWLFTTDNPHKPWFRKRGVKLIDVAENYGAWQSVQDEPKDDDPPRDEQSDLVAPGTDDLAAYGHSGFDVYKGNGPEERARLAAIGAALPDSYWE